MRWLALLSLLGLTPAREPALEPAPAPDAVVVEWRSAEGGSAEVQPGVLVRAAALREQPPVGALERVEISWDVSAP
ncbi:MAG: hypothetical protein QM704_03520 [Anaeromyxobacteraceae bacterium]